VVEAKRWIVERTFAWFGKFRRLSKDYELVTLTSLSMMHLVVGPAILFALGVQLVLVGLLMLIPHPSFPSGRGLLLILRPQPKKKEDQIEKDPLLDLSAFYRHYEMQINGRYYADKI
jgi:Transposase DDE domain